MATGNLCVERRAWAMILMACTNWSWLNSVEWDYEEYGLFRDMVIKADSIWLLSMPDCQQNHWLVSPIPGLHASALQTVLDDNKLCTNFDNLSPWNGHYKFRINATRVLILWDFDGRLRFSVSLLLCSLLCVWKDPGIGSCLFHRYRTRYVTVHSWQADPRLAESFFVLNLSGGFECFSRTSLLIFFSFQVIWLPETVAVCTLCEIPIIGLQALCCREWTEVIVK